MSAAVLASTLACACGAGASPDNDAAPPDARIDADLTTFDAASGAAPVDGESSWPDADATTLDAGIDAPDGDVAPRDAEGTARDGDLATDGASDPADAGRPGDDRFGPPPELDTGEQSVTDPFVGVRLIHRTTILPRPLSYHLVLVDPHAPGVSFTVTADNGEVPRETTRRTTRGFVSDVGAQLGINAHFFAPWPPVDDHSELLGICISDGEVVSRFEPGWDVGFAISPTGEARVVRWLEGDATGIVTAPAMTIDDAVGAQEMIVSSGASTATWEELHPRTAIGVSGSGIVVMMIVDGRQDGVSEGMTTPEMAAVLIELGVTDAINLDGGGSTTLVVADPIPRVINHPVGLGIPDTERTNGASPW
jgi:hypothetical protein